MWTVRMAAGDSRRAGSSSPQAGMAEASRRSTAGFNWTALNGNPILARGGAVLAALVFLLFAAALPAAAHTADISTARIVPKGDRLYSVDVALLATDLERMFSTEDQASDLSAPGALEKAIGLFILKRVDLEGADGKKCRGSVDSAGEDPESADGARIVMTFDCSDVQGNIFYNAQPLLEVAGSRARQHTFIGEGANASQSVVDQSNARFDLSAPPASVWQLAGRYLYAGVEHILTGYDHIAFLLAVVLWARRVWPVVKIVTAFTVSHSVTLSLAVLGIARLPAAPIEAAIAFSIIFVAVENFFSRNVDNRWMVTFLFGFIHGFGFASGLLELGVPRNAIAPALASFNIGVELGQIGIVLIVVPALLAIDRLTGGKRSPRLVYGASIIIALLGGYWLLMRTVFLHASS
ncbi:HupE/UreJ family protein [Methylocapsa acidiphila]|nr:HupE/UreJ family protein [Methylocapsa acidiphila]